MSSSDTTEFFNRSKNRLDQPQSRLPTRQPKPNQPSTSTLPQSSPSTQPSSSPPQSDDGHPNKRRKAKARAQPDGLLVAPPARNRARAIQLRAQAAGGSNLNLSAPRPLTKQPQPAAERSLRLSSDSDSDGQGKGKAKERGSPGRDEREESARLPSLTALEEHSSRLREMAKLSGWQPKVGSELEKVMSGRSDELRVEDDHREVNGGGGKAGGVNGVAKDKPTRGPRPPSSPGDITDPYDNYKGPPHSRLKNLASTSAAATRTPTSAAAKPKRSNSSTAKKRTPAAAPTPSPPEDEPVPFMDPLPAAPPADFWGVAGGARPAATKGKKRAHGEATRSLQSLSDMRNTVSGGLAEGLGMMSDDIVCGDTEEESGGEGGKYESVAAKAKREREEAKGEHSALRALSLHRRLTRFWCTARLIKSREKKASGVADSPAAAPASVNKGKGKVRASGAPPDSQMLKVCDICTEQVMRLT